MTVYPEDAAADAPVRAPPRSLFLAAFPPIALPVFLAAADGTVVATALPAIAASLGEVERLSWVVVANLIANTIAAPAYGRLGDLFGRRAMMLAALAIFTSASLLCAFATSLDMLIAARVLQGLGGGGLMTLAQALLGENVPPRARGAYQGYLSACIVAGATFAPVAGGLLTELYGWHSVFLSYLPLCAIAMLLVLRLPRGVHSQGRASFDALGLVLLAAFIVPLLLALSSMQRLDPSAVPMMAEVTGPKSGSPIRRANGVRSICDPWAAAAIAWMVPPTSGRPASVKASAARPQASPTAAAAFSRSRPCGVGSPPSVGPVAAA